MNVQQVAGLLRRRWRYVVAVTAVLVAVAWVIVATTTPVYTATARCFVTVSQDPRSGSIFQGSQFALTRVTSYTDLVNSPAVLQPVINELKLPVTTSGLASTVTAVNQANTVLINISATSTEPAQAATVSNAVALQFSRFIQRLETTGTSGASPVKVTVTSPAIAPTTPTSPRRRLSLAIGALLGLALGALAAATRDRMDTSVRTTAELQRSTGVSLLGLVPFESQMAPHELLAMSPLLTASESFRTIRTNLQFVDVDEPPRVIVVTSANPAEGKTTTACNLAVVLAQSGVRVCLVEADLRRPTFAERFGMESSVGLTTVLAQQANLDDVLSPWWVSGLSALSAGPVPPNPSELLGSNRMRVVVETLRESFDVVIIDAPPLLPVTDAAVLSRMADGVVLTVRHARTSRDDVLEAARRIQAINSRLIGSVLTFAPRINNGYGPVYGAGVQAPARRGLLSRKTDAPRHSAAPTGDTMTPPQIEAPLSRPWR